LSYDPALQRVVDQLVFRTKGSTVTDATYGNIAIDGLIPRLR